MIGHSSGDASWHREQNGIKTFNEREVIDIIQKVGDMVWKTNSRGVVVSDIVRNIAENPRQFFKSEL